MNDIDKLEPGERLVSSGTEISYVVGRKRECCKDNDNHIVINFDRMWGEGDVICKVCFGKVRSFDSG